MSFDLIRGILNSKLNAHEKLSKIEKLVKKEEDIEKEAIKYAVGQKPTINDKLKAAKALSKNIKMGVDQSKLRICLDEGIKWLIKIIEKNGGWRINENKFKPYIIRRKPIEQIRPLKMLFVSPWDISMTILTLLDWIKFFSPGDYKSEEVIKNGMSYLKRIQSSFDNGGLGDSIWSKRLQEKKIFSYIKRIKNGEFFVKKKPVNTMETCIALLVWINASIALFSDISEYEDPIRKGLEYLKNISNEKKGGWGFKEGSEADIKSTALVVIVYIMAFMIPLESFSLREKRFQTILYKGLGWILDKQNQDGSWDYLINTRDSAIFGTFYAVEALNIAKHNLLGEYSSLRSFRYKLDTALGKALCWYKSSYKLTENDSENGLYWENHIKSSGVENTAAGIIVLLDSAWIDENSVLLEKNVNWLMQRKHHENFWFVDTPLVLTSFMRILEPKLRLPSPQKQKDKRIGQFMHEFQEYLKKVLIHSKS